MGDRTKFSDKRQRDRWAHEAARKPEREARISPDSRVLWPVKARAAALRRLETRPFAHAAHFPVPMDWAFGGLIPHVCPAFIMSPADFGCAGVSGGGFGLSGGGLGAGFGAR
jgi:hypothetical protein